MEELILT